MIRPCFNKLSSAVRTVLDGMANPIPCDPPLREMIAVLMPDHFAAKIDQWAAAVPGINRGIRLQQIAETIGPVRPPFRADDSVRHRFFETEMDCRSRERNRPPARYRNPPT